MMSPAPVPTRSSVRSPALVAVVAVVAVLLLRVEASGGAPCLDLVRDCGAKADGTSDDTAAFGVCQTRLAPQGGCVAVPAGHYAVMNVQLNASNVAWEVDNAVVFTPWPGMTRSLPLFRLGSDVAVVRNVSIGGTAPGKFTVDVSRALVTPWNVRGIMVDGGLDGFAIANARFLMVGAHVEAQKSALEFGNRMLGATSLNPRNGHVVNITSVGSSWGYGTVQTQSCEDVVFENLDGTGGVTLRLETGFGAEGAFLGNITGRNIVCRDGHAALMSQPHQQENGRFEVHNATAIGCLMAAELNGGYEQHGKPPGHFHNDSAVDTLVAVYGTQAQGFHNLTVPSCCPCGTENVHLNYDVAVTNLVSRGFPPPSARNRCAYWTRFPLPPACPWATPAPGPGS